jgi:hypothetical protein
MFVYLMEFNVTFNNISVLLVEGTGGPGEDHRPVASHWQTWSHNVVLIDLIEIRTHNISGERHWLHIGSCKSSYHTITTTTAPPPKKYYIATLLSKKQSSNYSSSDLKSHTFLNYEVNTWCPLSFSHLLSSAKLLKWH